MFSNIERDNPDVHGDDINDETFGVVLGHDNGSKDLLEGEGELEAFDFEQFIGDPSVNKAGNKLEAELSMCSLDEEDLHLPTVSLANPLTGVQQGMCVIGELEQMLVSADNQGVHSSYTLQASHDKTTSYPRFSSNFEPMGSDASNIWATSFPSYPNSSVAQPQHQHESPQTLLHSVQQSSRSQVFSSNRSGGVLTVDDLENSWLGSKHGSTSKNSVSSSMPSSDVLKEHFRSGSSKQDVSHMEPSQKMEAVFRNHVAPNNSSDLHHIQVHDQDLLTNLLHQLHLKQSVQPSVETALNSNGNIIQNHPSSVFSRSQDRAIPPNSSFPFSSSLKSPVSQLPSITQTLSSPSSSKTLPPLHPQLHQVWQLFFKELQSTFLRIGESYINESCDFDKFKKDIMELHKVASQRGLSLNIPSAYIDSTFKKLCDAVVSQKHKLLQQKHQQQIPQINTSSVLEAKTPSSSSSAQPSDESASAMQHLRLLLQQQQYPQQLAANRGQYPHHNNRETIGWPTQSNATNLHVNPLPVKLPSPVHQFSPTSAQKSMVDPMLSRPVQSSTDPSQLLLQQQAALLSLYLRQQQQQKGFTLPVQSFEGNEIQRQLNAALVNASRQVGSMPPYEAQRSPNMRLHGNPDQHNYHGNYAQKSNLPEWMDEEVESPISAALHQQPDNGSWMMRQEKEWLLRIMTKQMSCDNPYRQDYYFTRRTLNRMMKQYNDDVRQLQQQGGPPLKPNHPLSYLPSPVTADELMSGHDVIAASLSGQDVSNVEPMPYRPPVEQSENNLGRLTVSSCYTPRQIIDVTTSGGCDLSQWKGDIKTSIPQDNGDRESIEVSNSFLHYKHVLMTIENLYVHVLQLDELTISLQKLVAQTRYRDVMEQYKEKLINHVMKELAAKPYGLKNILTIKKGCSLVLKFGYYLDGNYLRELFMMCFSAMNEGLAEEENEFGAALSQNVPLLVQLSVHYPRLSCKIMEDILHHCCTLTHLCLHSVPYTLAYELLDQFGNICQKENENSFVLTMHQWVSMLKNFPPSRHAGLLKNFSMLWQAINDHLTPEQRVTLEPYNCINFSSVETVQSSKEISGTTNSCNEYTIPPNSESEPNSLPAS